MIFAFYANLEINLAIILLVEFYFSVLLRCKLIAFSQSVAIAVDNMVIRITHGAIVHDFYHNVPRLYSIGYSYSAQTFDVTSIG
jgi:hypothetical protein